MQGPLSEFSAGLRSLEEQFLRVELGSAVGPWHSHPEDAGLHQGARQGERQAPLCSIALLTARICGSSALTASSTVLSMSQDPGRLAAIAHAAGWCDRR